MREAKVNRDLDPDNIAKGAKSMDQNENQEQVSNPDIDPSPQEDPNLPAVKDDESLDLKSDSKTLSDYAMALVHRDGHSFEDLRVKSIGLSLSLIGLAEVQASRVQQLGRIVSQLEERVFDEDNQMTMEPKQLLELYKVATDALGKSTDYLKSVLSNTDWNKLESDLVTIQARRSTAHKDVELSGLAKNVLKYLDQMRSGIIE